LHRISFFYTCGILPQILQLLGGRYVNISHDTIAREEMERIKAEEWIGVLQDGGNQVPEKGGRRSSIRGSLP
jgi:hypothetical protein